MFRHHDEEDSNKKQRRHKDDIHDEDLENQQLSPHPMPPIVLPQAFLHAPNTFKAVSHISAMNNTSFSVLNFKTWFTACAHVPNPSFISISFFTIIFPFFSPNPSFISISFYHYIYVHCPKIFISLPFYHYISVHCPKTQALSL